MSQKRSDFPCPKCGERVRKNALRCSSCGTANPLRQTPSLEERIGLRGTVFLLIVASVVLVVLSVWLIYELVALGRVNPYLLGAGGLLVVVGIGARFARKFRP